jgi:hypothetical protein
MKRQILNITAMALILGLSEIANAQTWDQGGNSGVLNTQLGTNDLTNLDIITNGQTRIVVKSTDGNVGIGTDKTTGFKLSVEGKVRAREVFINLDTWADYVFSDTFCLMPLNELDSFIQVEKHLPDVPSEQEATENPQSVGETQTVLLQKIEELTLYIIQLNKRIEELEAAKQ